MTRDKILQVRLVCSLRLNRVYLTDIVAAQIKNSLPTGTDSQLTQELRLLEQQLGEAAMHMDTKALERLWLR